ncbi:MAG: tetratricopeptide repeat protein [Gammaproteobacteria bacterium]|nr:tetratricopeptide repeat protein [Gammaproteobacteria bacterium]
MPGSSNAVFLSYASEDAEAAERIATALHAACVEVWFDKSELRGGDAWDQKIRKQIKTCALFIPLISHATHARREGYFRLEWKLAVDRSHLMDAELAFLVPVVIDDTRDDDERVPDRFREVHWTRLPGGETPPAFVERIKRLLSPNVALATQVPAGAVPGPPPEIRRSVQISRWPKAILLSIVAAAVLAAPAYFWISRHPAPSAAAFAPPAHSIAVLPFVNMSGDKEQDYFSDGLTEELLNSLAEINELQVAARTSAFAFKGRNLDIGTIARKLNVASVLEGSVRRSGNTVRVTTQLINAVTGFHLWSHTYDRDLGDVLKLETEIADAVASALKVSLLGDVATKIELGGTRNPAAFDAYLRGRKAHLAAHGDKDYQTAITAYTDAIGLDPNYALAFANRSLALRDYANEVSGSLVRESFDKAQTDARKALALAPDLAEGHLALASYFESGLLDYTRANEEYERALALASGNARAVRGYGRFAGFLGRTDVAIATLRRAVVLDPLSRESHSDLGAALYWTRQNNEAIAAFRDALALDPENPRVHALLGAAYYALGDFQSARASCERNADYWESQWCLAVTYHKLGRHADAEAQLAKLKAAQGDDVAYQYADIYAQWNDTPKALEWLETALRVRDAGLVQLKVDPQVDPLRKEPRFQAVMRELKFPE